MTSSGRVDALEPDGEVLARPRTRRASALADATRRAGRRPRGTTPTDSTPAAPRRRPARRPGGTARSRSASGRRRNQRSSASSSVAPAHRASAAATASLTPAHSTNTRCSSGSAHDPPGPHPAADDHGEARRRRATWPDRRLRRPRGRRRPTCRPAPCRAGTMSTKRRANRTPACLARGVLAALRCPGMRSSARAVEPAVEVGAADLVGDEQRLAGGVGGGVGQPVLEHVERCGRSRWTAATRAGRRRTPGRSSSGPARPDLEQRLGDRPARATPVRMRISSIIRGHASWARARRSARRRR